MKKKSAGGSRPQTLEQQVKALAKSLWESPYSDRVRDLLATIRGKVVKSSVPGTGGYMLRFMDGTWVLCLLQKKVMHWRVGIGDLSAPELSLLHTPAADRPKRGKPLRAAERYSMARELERAHGKPVTNVNIGEHLFSLCFPQGWELQPHVVPGPRGEKTLRVYWTQW